MLFVINIHAMFVLHCCYNIKLLNPTYIVIAQTMLQGYLSWYLGVSVLFPLHSQYCFSEAVIANLPEPDHNSSIIVLAQHWDILERSNESNENSWNDNP